MTGCKCPGRGAHQCPLTEYVDPPEIAASIGTNVAFSVEPQIGNLQFQWLMNGNEKPNETNAVLTLPNVGLKDVGLYSCRVMADKKTTITSAATLMVYFGGVSSAETNNGVPFTVFGPPVSSLGSGPSCPGGYSAYVNYTKTVAQGWGWAPTANTPPHHADDTVGSGSAIEYVGKTGDSGCSLSPSHAVPLPDSPPSTKYRFTIFFKFVPSTNAYPITLTGFDQ